MSDVFSRQSQAFGGSFAADAAQISFSSIGGFGSDALLGGGVGLLTQSLACQYSQNITRVYELGTNRTFLIAGRVQGRLDMQRILGPRPVQVAFYSKFGNVCNAATNNIGVRAQTGCASAGDLSSIGFGVKSCVIETLGLNINSQDMILNEALSMMFCSMDLQAA